MLDYQDWLDRWEAQQTYYLPHREERFNFMLDVIEAQIGKDFVLLDLGCGPGSLSKRIADRFPDAKIYAIDVDPMLLEIAKNTVGKDHETISFLDVDLRQEDWFDQIDDESVDVVVSTTALHWLPPSNLLRLYQQLADIIRDSGIFMNGDHIRYAPSQPNLQQISEDIKELWEQRGDRMVEGETWEAWWDAVKADFSENNLDELVEERKKRFHWRDHTEFRSPSYPLQVGALQDAGFAEVDTIWQHLHNRILLAIR